jgi:hypothetical protein
MLAFGQERSARAFADAQSSGAVDRADFVRPLLLLAAAGILLGLIATLRVSPLGAALTGGVYTASYVAMLIDPTWLLSLFAHDLAIAGRHADPATPIRTGTALLLGALLLVAVVSVGRWRRWPLPAVEAPGAVPERDSLLDGLGVTAEPGPTRTFAAGPERTGTTGSYWPASGSENSEDARR